MKQFLVIETADVEILGVRLFTRRQKADEYFTHVVEENGEFEWSSDEMSREIVGTLRMAGDDSYCAQMIEVESE